MTYYNIRISNLGFGWWQWRPLYRNLGKKYFWWLNWRIDWEVTHE